MRCKVVMWLRHFFSVRVTLQFFSILLSLLFAPKVKIFPCKENFTGERKVLFPCFFPKIYFFIF